MTGLIVPAHARQPVEPERTKWRRVPVFVIHVRDEDGIDLGANVYDVHPYFETHPMHMVEPLDAFARSVRWRIAITPDTTLVPA